MELYLTEKKLTKLSTHERSKKSFQSRKNKNKISNFLHLVTSGEARSIKQNLVVLSLLNMCSSQVF